MRAAEAASCGDGRIRVFSFPKGEGHGEAHRHTVLQQARGRYICALPDDDLWFPDHLEQMAILLSEFEFGNLLHANITVEGPLFIGMANRVDASARTKRHLFRPKRVSHRILS